MADTGLQQRMRRFHERASEAKKLLYKHMTQLIYVISAGMILFWVCSFFFFHAGWMVHLMPVLAVAAVILRATEKPGSSKR
ncbi:MAG: hypothetical protein ACXVP0_08770 [Bacteroidia bacterium]